MTTWSKIAADFGEHWPTYATMPLFAAAIGYLTKLAAVEMLFRPLEFRGIPPFLGWQGLIPRYAPRMATVAVDLMLSRLISPQEIIDRIDPEDLARYVQEPMVDTLDELTRELMMRYRPGLWELLPEAVRKMVIKRIQGDAPHLIERMMDDLKTNIDLVFDLRGMAIEALMRDKSLMVKLIREVAHPEMRFIVRSGLLFGFILGCAQMITWAFTKSALIMPLFGAFVGYSTDWLALQLIFRPILPRRYLGIIKWQGLFHKRRDQVATDYGALIANEILTPENIIEAMLTGPQSDRLFSLIQHEVDRVVDEQAGIAKPLVMFVIGSREYEHMKRDAVALIRQRLPGTVKEMEDYAMDAIDVHHMVIDKMKLMTSEEYENLLRPAFKQDEWKIVMVGAVLGFLVGELQVLLLLH
ncbi:DUF445 family protein [Nocardia sp. NPDC051030]|uniref:DUF445 domain-containing protein n=1 Tax=Nocardia sp. NPDC051030 TaxID=3155162 RepID=UPI00342C2822